MQLEVQIYSEMSDWMWYLKFSQHCCSRLKALCHCTVVPNILKECNAIKILGTTYKGACARRLECSYPSYLYGVVVINSLCSRIFHLSPKHHIWMRNVHAPYVGMSIFRSQSEDRLICLMVFVFFFGHSRKFVESVWNWPCPLPNPFQFVVCWHCIFWDSDNIHK